MKKIDINRPLSGIRLITNIWNILSINIGWTACILGAAWDMYWVGMVIVPVLIIIHIAVKRDRIMTVLLVAVGAIVVGFFTDTALILIGVVAPKRWILPFPLTTMWDLLIWANFSVTLNTSLGFLQKRPFWAAVLGAICAPGTYYAGDRLGALEFSEPVFNGLLWTGGVWLLAMPALSLMARYFYHSKKSEST